MAIKVKLEVIWRARVSLMRLGIADLEFKARYWIGRGIDYCTKELECLDKIRVCKLQETAEKDEKTGRVKFDEFGNAVFPTSEAEKGFQKGWEELLGDEIEIPMNPVKIKDLVGKTYIPLPIDFGILSFLYVEPTEAEINEIATLLENKDRATEAKK